MNPVPLILPHYSWEIRDVMFLRLFQYGIFTIDTLAGGDTGKVYH